MEQRLLQDLHHRLGDLEHKVRAYRHGMAAEFQSYCHQVLHDVPPAIVQNIEQSLATSMTKYSALAPELQPRLTKLPISPSREGKGQQGAQGDHRAVADSHQALAGAKSPADTDQSSPPPPGAAFGAAVDPGSGNPHEREKEFQGLFTPFFLPLLDSSPNLPSSPPLTAASPSLAEPVTAGTGLGSAFGVNVAAADQLQGSSQHLQGQDMEGSGETGARQGTSQAASPPLSRPNHVRRSTDDTASPTPSDKSDTKVPRSALRRSSSSSKPSNPSPRRVRFEFRGAEVLPTASPQPSDFPTPRPSSPTPLDQPRTFDEIVGDSGSKAAGPVEEEPPPRKISSTEALKALSRAPLDERTTWTVVNPGPEEPVGRKDSSSTVSTMSSKTTTPSANPTLNPTSSEGSGARQFPSTPNLPHRPGPEEDSDESSDEDFLSMGKSKSFKNKASIQPSTSSPPPDKTSQTKATASETLPKREEGEKTESFSEEYDDEDDVFHFETSGLSAPPRPKHRPPPLKEDTTGSPEPSSPGRNIEHGQAPQAISPAVPISRPSNSSGPSTPTATKFQVGSLGSYKGRSVIMPVVKNPEVHAQAASLGEFNTFVGGLDGRSGVDEGDLNSFRASLAHSTFSGTPRSLTERMMMEDAQAERGNGG